MMLYYSTAKVTAPPALLTNQMTCESLKWSNQNLPTHFRNSGQNGYIDGAELIPWAHTYQSLAGPNILKVLNYFGPKITGINKTNYFCSNLDSSD